jgi:hypothetical protein
VGPERSSPAQAYGSSFTFHSSAPGAALSILAQIAFTPERNSAGSRSNAATMSRELPTWMMVTGAVLSRSVRRRSSTAP